MSCSAALRNHLIERFERADAAADAATRRGCLTVVVIGGGLVGVELVGELTAFAEDVLRFYPRIRRDEVRFRLFEAGPRILPEFDAKLAAAAARVLQRRGVDLQVSTAVRAIEVGRVRLDGDAVDAGTIVLAAGIVPSAIASAIPVARDWRGRIDVDAAMRSRSHPEVWALGDCAAIPGPDGRPYPALAQHTLREGRHLAGNIRAVIDGRAPSPFMFRPLGSMASLGHTCAVAQVSGVRLTGFIAWWIRRTYYLFLVVGGRLLERRNAVTRDVDRVGMFPEALRQHVCSYAFVFDDQDPHRETRADFTRRSHGPRYQGFSVHVSRPKAPGCFLPPPSLIR